MEEKYEEGVEDPAVPFYSQFLVFKVDIPSMSADNVLEAIHANGICRNLYQGPAFLELAEDLQDFFHEYVITESFTEFGVKNKVSTFVYMYAYYKEQLGYIGYLQSVGKVL